MAPLVSHVWRDHVLLGGVVASFLAFHWGIWNGLLFWLANVGIDVDHYLHFIASTKFKPLGFRPMFRFHEQVFAQRHRSDFIAIELFHTLEFLILFAVLTFFILPSLQPIFWGFLFHNVVDLVHLARYRIFSKRAHSFVEYILRRKKMEAEGKSPDLIFVESRKALGL